MDNLEKSPDSEASIVSLTGQQATPEDDTDTSSPPTVSRNSSPDNDHGNRFQSKLLFLFVIRAINAGYKFHLGTELDQFSGKFDDLIFLTHGPSQKSFLYLQAKHKLHETPHPKARNITRDDLLKREKDDFSLIKYFHSYRDYIMKAPGGPQHNDNVDCVICTNIDFDSSLKSPQSTIKLKPLKLEKLRVLPRKILYSDEPIRRSGEVCGTNYTESFYDDVATFLLKLANSSSQNGGNEKEIQIYSKIHEYLSLKQNEGNVFVAIETGNECKISFHNDFIEGEKLSTEAKKLREAICKTVLDEAQQKNSKKNDNKNPLDKVDGEVTEAVDMNNIKVEENSWKNWNFIPFQKTPTCYRLTPVLWLERYFVAKVLWDCAVTPKKKLLDSQASEFKCYLKALVDEKVIDLKTKKLHKDFINEPPVDLSPECMELRKTIHKLVGDDMKTWKFTFNDKQIFEESKTQKSLPGEEAENDLKDFFENKLIFLVNSTNEEGLNTILKDEVGKNKAINLSDADLETSHIFNKMNKWFKSNDSVWLSEKDGKNLIEETVQKINSLRATTLSLDYQNELNKILSFNEEAVKEMLEEHQLDKFLGSSNPDDALQITTPSAKFTAVKAIAAIRHSSIESNYKQDDSYLVTSLSRLKNNALEREWIKNALLKEGNPQQLMIVVCDIKTDNSPIIEVINKTFLLTEDETKSLKKKKIILIREEDLENSNGSESRKDVIIYKKLSEDFQKMLLEKKVKFQGIEKTLGTLIEEQDWEQIEKNEFPFILEELVGLMMKEKDENSIISLFDPSPSIEPAVGQYIPSDFNYCELHKSSHTENLRQSNISDLIADDQKKLIIIFGLPGSGKSTALSAIYESIKQQNQDILVIRIDLAKHTTALKSTEGFLKPDPITYMVDHLVPDVKDSRFKSWFLKYRLKKRDEIVLMFDNLDKMNEEAQRNAISLFKFISKQKEVKKVFVAALWENFQELSNQKLVYSAYEPKKFEFEKSELKESQQKKYLSDYCSDYSCASEKVEGLKVKYDSFPNYVKEILEDEELKSDEFFGIPLHCKILADWYLSHLKSDSTRKHDTSLVGFYQFFISFKANKILSPQTGNYCAENMVANDNDEKLKSAEIYANKHYRNLAFETVFEDQLKLEEESNVKEEFKLRKKWMNILVFPYVQGGTQMEEEDGRKAALGSGIQFGLTYRVREGTDKFLQKSLADYNVAKFLYEGFVLKDDKHRKLLHNDFVRDLIVEKILVDAKYRRIRRFLNLHLGLEKIVWNQTWRGIIAKSGSLIKCKIVKEPRINAIESLKLFIKGFNRQNQNKETPHEYEALIVAVQEKHDNIFVLLLDCIEVMHYRRATKSTPDTENTEQKMLATFQYIPLAESDWTKPTHKNCGFDTEANIVTRLLSMGPPKEGLSCFPKNEKIDYCFLSFIREQLYEDDGQKNASATEGHMFFETKFSKHNNTQATEANKSCLEIVFIKE